MTTTRQRTTKGKRSAVAKKGWETRRFNAGFAHVSAAQQPSEADLILARQEEEAEWQHIAQAEKAERSLAAKKGWETRRGRELLDQQIQRDSAALMSLVSSMKAKPTADIAKPSFLRRAWDAVTMWVRP